MKNIQSLIITGVSSESEFGDVEYFTTDNEGYPCWTEYYDDCITKFETFDEAKQRVLSLMAEMPKLNNAFSTLSIVSATVVFQTVVSYNMQENKQERLTLELDDLKKKVAEKEAELLQMYIAGLKNERTA